MMNNIKATEIAAGTKVDRTIPIKRSNNTGTEDKKLLKAAKDMESLFMYHIIRAMRNTVPKNEEAEKLGFGDGLGKDIYTQLFDEELAKKISGNGDKSLANILYKSLTKKINVGDGESGAAIKPIKEALPEAKYIKIKNEENPKSSAIKSINDATENKTETKTIEKDRTFIPLSGKRMITSDPDDFDVKTANNNVDKKREPIRESRQADSISKISKYDEIINEASKKYQIEPALLESIIKAESGGDTTAVSRAGAKGLMQLADTTASDMGVNNVFDPKENIHGGAKYLRSLLDRFGDLKKALAAYNAGPETVKRYGGIPPYPETKKYVKTVLANMSTRAGRFE
jgi:Rod binding domain-containing protein